VQRLEAFLFGAETLLSAQLMAALALGITKIAQAKQARRGLFP
jgi:hypothetical protein